MGWNTKGHLQLCISHQMRSYLSWKAVWWSSYTPVFGYLRHQDNFGKVGPNNLNHRQRHLKSNTKLSASHFASNGSSYICLRVFEALRPFQKIGPKYTEITGKDWQKVIQIVNPIFHIMWALPQIERPSDGHIVPLLVYFGHWGI